MCKIRANRKNRIAKENAIEKLNNKEDIQAVATRFFHIVDKVENPRTRPCDYPLREILLVAVMCGSESYQDMTTFGEAQTEWFKQFVPLENGVPSHDTFRRVFMLLRPESLNAAYTELFQGLKFYLRKPFIFKALRKWAHMDSNHGPRPYQGLLQQVLLTCLGTVFIGLNGFLVLVLASFSTVFQSLVLQAILSSVTFLFGRKPVVNYVTPKRGKSDNKKSGFCLHVFCYT